MARRLGGAQGPPLAPSPTVATAHRPRRRPRWGLRADHGPPGCAAEPRQSTVNTPPAAFLRPCVGLDTARRRPDRPGSSCIGAQTCLRAVIDPPAYPESAPRRAPAARSARLRPVRSPVGRPSALGQVRCGPQRGPRRSMSPPLRPVGSPSSCPAAACADPQGPPAPPPRPPAQFPAGAGTRAHTYARACMTGNFRKKNERETHARGAFSVSCFQVFAPDGVVTPHPH